MLQCTSGMLLRSNKIRRRPTPVCQRGAAGRGLSPSSSVAAGAARAPGVRYLRLDRRTTIGARRNLACREARGAILVHWDDDDWYAPDRLRRQIAPILAGRADLTGLEGGAATGILGCRHMCSPGMYAITSTGTNTCDYRET